jgi:hypothetical protein
MRNRDVVVTEQGDHNVVPIPAYCGCCCLIDRRVSLAITLRNILWPSATFASTS